MEEVLGEGCHHGSHFNKVISLDEISRPATEWSSRDTGGTLTSLLRKGSSKCAGWNVCWAPYEPPEVFFEYLKPRHKSWVFAIVHKPRTPHFVNLNLNFDN